MGLFNRKNKVCCTIPLGDRDETFNVDLEVYNYMRHLEFKCARIEAEKSGLERELDAIRPIINDEHFETAISAGCGECKYVVRSPYNGRILGCRRKNVCEGFERNAE